MKSVGQIYEQMTVLINKNVKSDDNKEGLLWKPAEEYLACLTTKEKDLEDLLQADKKSWKEKLVEEEDISKAFRGRLQEMLVKQSEELGKLIETVPRYVLKKLPLWGLDDGKEVDFEYPTAEEFGKWNQQKTYITSMTFKEEKEKAYGIASVQFTYSNGKDSTEIRANSELMEPGEYIELKDKKVFEVSASDYYGKQVYRLGLKWLEEVEEDEPNEKGEKVIKPKEDGWTFNPKDITALNQKTLQISKDEELIGFYGVRGKGDGYFGQFGFIVKVRQI